MHITARIIGRMVESKLPSRRHRLATFSRKIAIFKLRISISYVCTKRRILIDESSPSKIIRIFILTRLKVVPSSSSRTVAFSFGWFLLLLSVPGKLIKTQGEEGTANTRIELVHNSRVSYSVPRLDRVKRISLISGG